MFENSSRCHIKMSYNIKNKCLQNNAHLKKAWLRTYSTKPSTSLPRLRSFSFCISSEGSVTQAIFMWLLLQPTFHLRTQIYANFYIKYKYWKLSPLRIVSLLRLKKFWAIVPAISENHCLCAEKMRKWWHCCFNWYFDTLTSTLIILNITKPHPRSVYYITMKYAKMWIFAGSNIFSLTWVKLAL